MKKLSLSVIMMSLGWITVYAQNIAIRPVAQLYAGVMGGTVPGTEAGAGLGVHYNQWIFGLQAGYDSYRFSSVPVLATARKYFGNKKWQPFISAGAGWNIAAVRENEKGGSYHYDRIIVTDNLWNPGTWQQAWYHSGLAAELGGGYGLRIGKNHHLTASLHYSTKTLKEEMNATAWASNSSATYVATNTYYMQRIHLRFGFAW